MRMENNRISEQVNLEIVRVKNQFQEKLQELAPLPDILKATQVKVILQTFVYLIHNNIQLNVQKDLKMYSKLFYPSSLLGVAY